MSNVKITGDFGNLRYAQVYETRPTFFRVYDSDQKEPHLLAEVWYSDYDDAFVFKQVWETLLIAELVALVAFMSFLDQNRVPGQPPREKNGRVGL